MAAKIQQRNEVVNKQCVELQKKLKAVGIRSSILKGQAIASLYHSSQSNLSLLRQSGDIDIYVDCGREKAIEYARSIQGDVDWDYKHLHLQVYPDTEVEMHYVSEVFLNLWKNRKLQKWFKEHENEMSGGKVNLKLSETSGTSETFIITPSVEFNLFYILLHTYRHFLYEGVGLRQLMDWYFVLKSRNNDNVDDYDNFLSLLKDSGMMRFTKGLMWIMMEVFGLEEKCQLCETDEKEGRYILEQVMMGGNFGHHDERLVNNSIGKKSVVKKVLKHNLHLLTHYPNDVIWAPIWIVYHWCWKRIKRLKIK